MRAVVQRVKHASVTVDGHVCAQIGHGLLVLLGVEHEDQQDDLIWLTKKLSTMRIFSDQDGAMNLSVMDCDGQIIVVSQFTLHASTRKGNRPSFIKAARPEHAEPLYLDFVRELSVLTGKTVQKGVFGADMQVALCNDGPVTIVIDSKSKE